MDVTFCTGEDPSPALTKQEERVEGTSFSSTELEGQLTETLISPSTGNFDHWYEFLLTPEAVLSSNISSRY